MTLQPMLHRYSYFLLFYLFFSLPQLISAEENSACETEQPFSLPKTPESSLLEDLLIVNEWNRRLNEKLPVMYNHLLKGGYFSMPSARMGAEGEIGAGYGYVPPYINYNLRVQLTSFLEVTGNYRIFKGVADPVLTRYGFGDFSDKGANIKLSLFSAEESRYCLPGLAIGVEDFIGTQSFKAYYVVMTQVFLKQNVEISVGFGAHRIHRWFGGMAWMPFRTSSCDYLKGLALVLEYDAIPYRNENIEKHPKGRVKKTPWQLGMKYRAWDCLDLSVAYIRGNRWAFTLSSFYNFGSTAGLIPKIEDRLPYQAPINFQPIGALRSVNTMLQELIYAFRFQGFELSEAWLCDEQGRKVLRLSVTNMVYREERQVRNQLNALLSSLAPSNIDKVVIVLDVTSMPIQEWHYETAYLKLFHKQEIGRYELNVLTPLREVAFPNIYTSRLLFKRDLEGWNVELLPKTRTLFGSARGKFKYELGLALNVNGFLFNKIFYNVSLGYFFLSNVKHSHDVDLLNPSQLINVRTDIVKYDRAHTLTVDQAYLEQVWNWGKGWYTRLALGIFEVEYGGVASEWLYYPVNSAWAVGMDFAILKKRTPHGVDFTDQARKLKGFKPHHVKFLGTQYFLNVYYDWRYANLDFKFKLGKFLADDFGIRSEISRYYPSGLRVGFWYTYTNAKDIINGQVYHDKGVFFSIPLDIFYTRTNRSRWGYGMSAWLRDVGVIASTGAHLYETINRERQ